MAFARRSQRRIVAGAGTDSHAGDDEGAAPRHAKRSAAKLAWSTPEDDGTPGEGELGAEDAPAPDPQAELERARGLAFRALNRRDRTVAEMRRLLAEKEIGDEAAAEVVGELLAGGYLDDVGYAARFFEDRARLDGWGAGRVERRLLELGIDPESIAATLASQVEGAEAARAFAVLQRRFPVGRSLAERRERDRALGVLLRKGYGYEPALAAVRRHVAEATARDVAD